MARSSVTHWYPLKPANRSRWLPITGMEDMAEELTLAMDESTGDYASRPPGEVHGPFRAETGCVVQEMSCPSQSVE